MISLYYKGWAWIKPFQIGILYVNLQAKAKPGLNQLRSIFTCGSDMLTVDLENTTEHALINLKTSTKHVYMMKVDIVLLDLHGFFGH